MHKLIEKEEVGGTIDRGYLRKLHLENFKSEKVREVKTCHVSAI